MRIVHTFTRVIVNFLFNTHPRAMAAGSKRSILFLAKKVEIIDAVEKKEVKVVLL